ncbi:hypothetical protein C9I49_02220 [Pseudomonas prosekii]|uniref:Uncharacterized protein n=1 Tax=Pseudomonas prosekii TaxID=1148509 RepID=A0A2U2DEF8_9PSED|nr:hypothetical protein C9I49_02220 [Pseudomonas prosekii]
MRVRPFRRRPTGSAIRICGQRWSAWRRTPNPRIDTHPVGARLAREEVLEDAKSFAGEPRSYIDYGESGIQRRLLPPSKEPINPRTSCRPI